MRFGFRCGDAEVPTVTIANWVNWLVFKYWLNQLPANVIGKSLNNPFYLGIRWRCHVVKPVSNGCWRDIKHMC